MLFDYGPFHLSMETYQLIENKGDSILDFADFLVADLPAGTGFSLTDEFPTSNEQAVDQAVTFLNLLSESSLLKRNGINLKKRPLVLWGVSYGGGYLP
jgi:carboxypeptidase C (cathepsin A)